MLEKELMWLFWDNSYPKPKIIMQHSILNRFMLFYSVIMGLFQEYDFVKIGVALIAIIIVFFFLFNFKLDNNQLVNQNNQPINQNDKNQAIVTDKNN